MTKEEILAMVPGVMLDSFIAEKIMGYKVTREYSEPYLDSISISKIPYYSTDIATAWEVVKKYSYLYLYRWDKQPCKFFCKPGQWECKLTEKDNNDFIAIGKTAPEAICKAALLTTLDGEE